MPPRARNNKKGDGDEQKVQPSKEQDEIAKYIRFNCPTNTTMFQENEAHYFSGSKAVDTLLNSTYGNKAKGEPKFADRNTCIHYIQELMDLGMFFRAKKLVPKKDKETKKKDKKDSDVSASEQDDKKDEKEEKDDKKPAADGEKKKKKVKLEYHQSQVFLDDKDVYVWIFDPTPLWKKLVGFGMVVVTIVGCCFPLWPMWMRQGVWYLSMAGLGAFGAILVTAILRTILFGIIWLATGGQHKLWILPNLTEDCGFFESFKPWYTYEYCPRGGSQSTGEDEKKKKSEKKKKDKDSDAEEETVPVEKKDEKGEDSAGSVSEEDEEQQNSTGGSASDSEPSVPPSPESSNKPRKRRARREDDGFVHVN